MIFSNASKQHNSECPEQTLRFPIGVKMFVNTNSFTVGSILDKAVNETPKIQISSQEETEHLCFSEYCLNILDVAEKIFTQSLFIDDVTSVLALACTNVTISHNINYLAGRINLIQLCPQLTILDAKAQKSEVKDEPPINNLLALKWFRKLSPLIEDNEGLTVLTVLKGLTLRQLMDTASKEGITVSITWDRILEQFGNVPVEHTYRVMISNNLVTETRNSGYSDQEGRMRSLGCELPSAQEYVTVCIFQQIFNTKYLYWKQPFSFGRSSSLVNGQRPLVVGASYDPTRFCVVDTSLGNALNSGVSNSWGAGCKRKL